MNLIQATEDQFQFQLGQRERDLLLELLKLYPCLPSAHQPLSKSNEIPDREMCQQLLDEALAEQRTENRRQLLALLADPRRFRKNETGWRLCLSVADLEWLLQILNDIRVGSWVLLGSPEEGTEVVTEKTVRHVAAMRLAGYFQAELLEASRR